MTEEEKRKLDEEIEATKRRVELADVQEALRNGGPVNEVLANITEFDIGYHNMSNERLLGSAALLQAAADAGLDPKTAQVGSGSGMISPRTVAENMEKLQNDPAFTAMLNTPAERQKLNDTMQQARSHYEASLTDFHFDAYNNPIPSERESKEASFSEQMKNYTAQRASVRTVQKSQEMLKSMLPAGKAELTDQQLAVGAVLLGAQSAGQIATPEQVEAQAQEFQQKPEFKKMIGDPARRKNLSDTVQRAVTNKTLDLAKSSREVYQALEEEAKSAIQVETFIQKENERRKNEFQKLKAEYNKFKNNPARRESVLLQMDVIAQSAMASKDSGLPDVSARAIKDRLKSDKAYQDYCKGVAVYSQAKHREMVDLMENAVVKGDQKSWKAYQTEMDKAREIFKRNPDKKSVVFKQDVAKFGKTKANPETLEKERTAERETEQNTLSL